MAQRAGGSSRGGRPRRSGGNDDGDEQGELLTGTEVRTGLIRGATFAAKPVQYVVRDGTALFEGDIVLGTSEEVEQRTQEIRDELTGKVAAGVVITGSQYRWPNCRIPYTIDPALPNQSRVTDAIAHWEANTPFRFPGRTSETDYVTFRPSSGCSSSVGRQGGQQFINLGSGCTTGNAIHEIGHTVGLWHEQSREDRDAFVTIHWDKIQAGLESNFNQHITDGDDIGQYDYGSIMHYPRDAFSVDGSDTITPTDPTATIGQRTALSAGDIAAARSACPTKIAKEHIKDLPFDTKKEQVKDLRFDTRKELVFDTLKEIAKDHIKDIGADTIKEAAWDTIKEAALDPPFKPQDPVVTPGRLVGPAAAGATAGAVPFAIATPHEAPALMAQSPDELQTTAAQIDAMLHAIADQLAALDAQRAALQAQYDELQAVLQQALAAHDQA